MIDKITNHIEEYIARYTVLLLAILTPAAGLLGELASNLGGADTTSGKYVLGAASAVGTAIAGVTFLKNLGEYQKVRDFGHSIDSTAVEIKAMIDAAKKIPDSQATTRPVEPGTEDDGLEPTSRIGLVSPGQEFPLQPPTDAPPQSQA